MVSLASMHLLLCMYLARASKHILGLQRGVKVNEKFSNLFYRYLSGGLNYV